MYLPRKAWRSGPWIGPNEGPNQRAGALSASRCSNLESWYQDNLTISRTLDWPSLPGFHNEAPETPCPIQVLPVIGCSQDKADISGGRTARARATIGKVGFTEETGPTTQTQSNGPEYRREEKGNGLTYRSDIKAVRHGRKDITNHLSGIYRPYTMYICQFTHLNSDSPDHPYGHLKLHRKDGFSVRIASQWLLFSLPKPRFGPKIPQAEQKRTRSLRLAGSEPPPFCLNLKDGDKSENICNRKYILVSTN